MHELALTEAILESAVPTAQKNGAKKILAIHLKIGELSGVIPDCIRYYFDTVSKGTIAENAKIVSESIPPAIHCDDCSGDSIISRGQYTCPLCGSRNFKLTAGREYFIESLEVE